MNTLFSWLFYWHLLINPSNTCELTVVISNINTTKGNVLIGLYDNAADFPDPTRIIKGFKITASQAKEGFIIAINSKKPYAFAIFQDTNNNGILDKNSFGIPEEAYAFSNNAMGVFGPPSFQKASFSCQSSIYMQYITLRY